VDRILRAAATSLRKLLVRPRKAPAAARKQPERKIKMTNLPELFDSKGGVRQDFTETELAAIPSEIKPRFDALHEAATACAAGEQRIRDGQKAVREAKADVDRKQARLAEIKPALTYHDLWKLSVGKVPAPIEPEIEKKIVAIEAALIDAQEVLALAQDGLAAAQHAIVPLRKAQAVSFAEYQAEFPARSFSEVHRDMAANYKKPEPEVRQFLTAIDAIAAGTKEAPRRRHPRAVPGLAFRRGGTTQRPPMASLAPRAKLSSEV
jgi:hypothetical protein